MKGKLDVHGNSAYVCTPNKIITRLVVTRPPTRSFANLYFTLLLGIASLFDKMISASRSNYAQQINGITYYYSIFLVPLARINNHFHRFHVNTTLLTVILTTNCQSQFVNIHILSQRVPEQVKFILTNFVYSTIR